MDRHRAPPIPLVPWLVATMVLGGALGPWDAGPWLTGGATILVLVLDWRALPWLGFLVGGWLLARSLEAPSPLPPVPARLELEVEVLAPGRDTMGGQVRTPVRPTEPAGSGRRWTLQEPAHHPARERGDRLWLLAQAHASTDGTRVTLRVDHPDQARSLPGSGPGPWQRTRRWMDRTSAWLEGRLVAALDPLTVGLVDALLRGDTGRLEQADRDRLRRCGVWHLLVISGLHVALLGHLLERWLRARCRPGVATLVTILVLGAFALWTGARSPVARATLVFLAAHLSRRAHRPTISSPALALVFVLLIVTDPGSLHSVGTQLSFVAVLGISASTPFQFSGSPRGTGTGFRPWQPLRRTLVLSTAASLATMPWCAWHFGQCSPWSPLTTLLFAPLLGMLAAGALLMLALQPLLPGMAALLGGVLDAVARSCCALLREVDGWPGTPWLAAAPHPVFLAASLVALLLLQSRRTGLALCVLLAGAGLGPWCSGPDRDRATLLDVGQGQCLWVHCAGRDWLIDSGAMTDAAEHDVRRQLARRGVSRVEAVFVSHLDADHCRFVARWLRDGFVRSLLLSAAHEAEWRRESASATVMSLRLAAREASVPVRFLARGDQEGPFQVQWPPRGRRFFADNDGSLVLSFPVGEGEVLAPGDTGSHALIELAMMLEPHEILLLPHHGNPEAALGALLDRCRPLLALASRGAPLEGGPRQQLQGGACAWRATATHGPLDLPVSPR